MSMDFAETLRGGEGAMAELTGTVVSMQLSGSESAAMPAAAADPAASAGPSPRSEGAAGAGPAPSSRRQTLAGTESSVATSNRGAASAASTRSSAATRPVPDHGEEGDETATDAAGVERVHDTLTDEDEAAAMASEASDRRTDDYQRRYDQLRLRREVDRLEGVATQLKEREQLLRRYYSDVTLPVTDDVGITLGQIRALALQLGSPQMDGLVDKLETAIEDQMLTLLTHLRGGSNDALVEGTDFERRAKKRDAKRSERRRAIENATETHVSEAEASEMLHIAATAAQQRFGSPNASSPRRARLAAAAGNGADAASSSPSGAGGPAPTSGGGGGGARGSRPPRVPSMGSAALASNASFGLGTANAPASAASLFADQTVAGGFMAEDIVGATSYLTAESIAKAVRCERVRIYFASTDGLTVRHATSFPTEPPSALPPTLPRSLITSVFHRGLAVAGFQQNSRDPLATGAAGGGTGGQDLKGASARVMQQLAAKQKAAAAAMNAGLPRCTLVFPVVVWQEGKKRVVGVIECLDKEPGEDEVTMPGDDVAAGGAATSSNQGKRFTTRDEVLVFTASQLLGALMTRYPTSLFATDLGPSLQSLNSAAAASGHLPAVVTGDIAAAAQVGNRSLRAAPAVDIFRGPMTSVHRFAVSKEGEQNATTTNANNKDAPQAGIVGSGGGGGGGGASSAAGGGSSDIRNVEESLDSLNAMWRKAYEDNVQMHRQCRNMSERMAEMRRVTERFEDVLSTARELATAEDVHDFLRVAELSLKAGKAAEVDRAIDSGLATAERARALIVSGREAGSQGDANTGGGGDGDGSDQASAGANAVPAAGLSKLGDHLTLGGGGGPSSSRPPTAPAPPGASAPMAPKPRRVPTAAKRAVPIADVHYDGPAGVRPYTVDPVTKRDQNKAIDAMILAEEDAKHEAERRRLAAIPGYARDTNANGRRVERSPFERAVDAAEIDGRLLARRVLANETMGGVPLKSSGGVHDTGYSPHGTLPSPANTARPGTSSGAVPTRPGTGGGVGGRRSVPVTGRTPFRMQSRLAK